MRIIQSGRCPLDRRAETKSRPSIRGTGGFPPPSVPQGPRELHGDEVSATTPHAIAVSLGVNTPKTIYYYRLRVIIDAPGPLIRETRQSVLEFSHLTFPQFAAQFDDMPRFHRFVFGQGLPPLLLSHLRNALKLL